MVAQTVHSFKDGDRVVEFRTGEQIDWQTTGETTPTVELSSRTEDGYGYTCKAVIPLAEAVEFAKRILALAAQAEEDAWYDHRYQLQMDYEFTALCAVEHGSGYSSGVYYPSVQ